MKNNLITLILSMVFSIGFAQNSHYEFGTRYNPTIKSEELNEALFICEIMPEFCRHFALPGKEYTKWSELLKVVNSPEGYNTYPQENWYCPQEDYSKIIDYVSIEITAICHGKTITAQSTNDALTLEQKNIINTADLGTDINIAIKFKYKKWITSNNGATNEVKEGKYLVTVVPEAEAEYPGGGKQFSDYLTANIINKVSGTGTSGKLQNATITFTVNEEGQVVKVKILKSSNDPKIDNLILDAINKMPKWKPAKNAKGISVKQQFTIPFDGGGGC